MRFGKALAAAVDDLKRQGADKLIVDLRGGQPWRQSGVLDAGELLAAPTSGRSATASHRKAPGKDFGQETLPRVPMPRTKASLLATLAAYALRDKSVVLLTQGLGTQPFHGRIAVLVNEWTNSAGEMVASFAKENGLATVIGTKTAGNVLGPRTSRLDLITSFGCPSLAG